MKNTKKLITVKEFAKAYNLGSNKAYNLVNAKDFPCIRMGKKILIIADKVDDFIENSIGKTF